jgi:hypothetical protein
MASVRGGRNIPNHEKKAPRSGMRFWRREKVVAPSGICDGMSSAGDPNTWYALVDSSCRTAWGIVSFAEAGLLLQQDAIKVWVKVAVSWDAESVRANRVSSR